MEVIIDFRENKSGLIIELNKIKDIHVQEEVLDCGDIIIGRFLIERKTVKDLFSSVSDGRLFRQLLGMKFNSGWFPILIIEGIPCVEMQEIAPSFIRRMSLVAIAKFGVSVLRSENLNDTVSILKSLIAYAGSSKKQRPFNKIPKKPTELDKQQLFILASIPNIGSYKSESLIRHFGSIHGVFTASVEDLMKVEGIGKVQAEHIYNLSKRNIKISS